MAIAEDNKPMLASGCRWGGSQEEPVLLFPEGAIKVKGTGLAILGLCDGQRTFSEILVELQRQYLGADAQRIRQEAERFLEQLQEKRILDIR
jgi:pyrroloquinoline quinone biosynthesis protein D